MKKEFLVSILLIGSAAANLFGVTAFTGYAGGKLNQSAKEEADNYEGQLKLQAFFAGQFNFSQNLWSHLEFSIDTDNLLTDDIFKKTPAQFRIDELSITGKMSLNNNVNYVSAFIGMYDPIGSDILLQRYFGIDPIASKVTDSWLGTGNSILYPQWGIGISDVIKSYSWPGLIGLYLYVNSEDAEYKVFNADLRTAVCFRYFTMDLAAGLGAPLSDKNQGKDVIVAVDKLYWHMGTTFLLGNNYTGASLFGQMGINNASIKPKGSQTTITPETCYFLVEPRFYNGIAHTHISFYILPKDTVAELMILDNTMGVNLNIFKNVTTRNSIFTMGMHLCAGFDDKYIDDVLDYNDYKLSDLNVNLIPYFSTNVLTGTLNTSLKVKFKKFANGEPEKAFEIDIGYKCKL